MKIKKLTIEDVTIFKQLIEIFKDVFENEEDIASDKHLRKILAYPEFLVFVGMLEHKVIGGLTI